ASKATCQAFVPVVAVLRTRRHCASFTPRKNHLVFPSLHAALDASPEIRGQNSLTEWDWLSLFFWWLCKCEQRCGCFSVTLLFTWRVGALGSISERVDMLPSVRILKGSPMRGVLRVFPGD